MTIVDEIHTGKLNTLVNKFMAVSRLTGIIYISTLMVDKIVTTFYEENVVRTDSGNTKFLSHF